MQAKAQEQQAAYQAKLTKAQMSFELQMKNAAKYAGCNRSSWQAERVRSCRGRR